MDFLIRGAMFDESKVDYTGCVKIKPEAEKSEAHISHHSLIMSKLAKVHSLPSMEIETDNAKASHEATMGKPGAETLFYLSTRGVNKKEAERLLIKSFLETDLKNITNQGIGKEIKTEISKSI